MHMARWGSAHNLLAHAAIVRDFLSLRTSELLRAGGKGLVDVVLLTSTLRIIVVVHCGYWWVVGASEWLCDVDGSMGSCDPSREAMKTGRGVGAASFLCC